MIFLRNIIKFKFKLNINPPKFSNSLILFAISIIIFFNIDRIFLSYNSTLSETGQYNFFRVILSGFFILSMSYYYSLLPDISKFYKIHKIIYNKIYINFKSLNLILIFIISSIFLFIEVGFCKKFGWFTWTDIVIEFVLLQSVWVALWYIVKKSLSDIKDNIPLFNIYHINIYLIRKENVYYRSVYGNYRFPGKGTSEYTAKIRIDYANNRSSFAQSDFVIINI